MVKHFLLPLMKRKNNIKLNEGAQIPYSLQDFKEGDRVHVIGNFDNVNFDDLGTIVTTSREIENPWSEEDSILVKFDSVNIDNRDFHDGETGIREIAVKCYGKCWWIWLASFIPNYTSNPDDYYFDERNRVIKLNDNLPDAYDVISSLYESKDLIKENVIYPGIKVGDEVIVSFGYEGKVFADNEMATVLDITDSGWILLKFWTWNQGHNGHYYPKCGNNDCFYVKATDDSIIFSNLVVKRLDMPDAYDVISSLYESKEDDLDWAMDMVNNVNSGSLMTVIQKIPTTVDKDKFNVIVFRGPGITKKDITDVIMFTENNTNYTSFVEVENIIDYAVRMYNNKSFLYINLRPNGVKSIGSSPFTFKLINKVSLSDDSVNVIKFNADKKMNESDDFDWASDMVNNVNLAMTSIPTEDDGKKYVILFDKTGITYETIEAIVKYIQQETVWYFRVIDDTISSIYEYYKRGFSPYIRLFPGPELNFGDDEDAFNSSTGLYFNSPQVNIIRPY